MLGIHFPFQIPLAGPNVWILKTTLLLAATSLTAMLNLKQQAMSYVFHEDICAEIFLFSIWNSSNFETSKQRTDSNHCWDSIAWIFQYICDLQSLDTFPRHLPHFSLWKKTCRTWWMGKSEPLPWRFEGFTTGGYLEALRSLKQIHFDEIRRPRVS